MFNRLNWPARIAIAAGLLGLVIAGQHTFVSKLTDLMSQHMLDILAHRR